MRPFRDIPIKRKLMLIITGTSALVLFMACAAFFIFELVTYRARMVSSLQVRADVLGSSCLAPLLFDDPKAARQTLESLSGDPRIRLARVYSKAVQPFASYAREGEKAEFPSWPGADGSRFTPSRLVLVRGIFDGETRVGTLYLVEDLKDLYRGLGFFLALAAGVLLVFSGTAFWLSGMFQRLVSNALLELTRTARRVSETADYSVRAVKRGRDEVGGLVDGFNEMLAQIQERTADLRASERRLGDLMEYSPAVIVAKRLDGRYLFVNRQYERIFHASHEQVVGKTLETLWPKEFAETISGHDNRVLASGEPMTFEERLPQDGGFLTFLSVKFLLRDAAGAPYAVCAIATDITERKKTEEELRRALALLNATLESTADGILVVDHQGKIAGFNRRFVELWRIPEEIIASREDDRAIAHVLSQLKEPERFAAKIKELYALPKADSFDVLEFKDGRVFERFSKPQLLGDEDVGRVWSFRDITERKRAEEEVLRLNAGLERRVRERTAELSASETRFRAVAETAVDAIVSADAAGTIVSWNKGAQAIFGRSAAEAIGRSLTIIVPPRYSTKHLEGIARYVATGEAHLVGKGPVELFGRRKDGSEFPVELSLSSWKAGGDVFFTAIIRDTTRRKKAEHDLKSFTAQLETANKELESFSYSVAHDLRSPLRSIDGFSSILAEDYAEKLDARGQALICRVRAAAQRMSGLIDDMLNLARVTRTEMQSGVVDLTALARGICAELKRREPGRKVVCKILEGVRGWGDMHLLRILLENLIGNAWKFTSKVPEAVIEFGTTAQDGRPVYFVRDNGAGFDQAFADKLFKPFVRLHTTEEFPGTGVGLSIVSRIVERHGGRAWARGEVGKGATVFFTLQDHPSTKEGT